MNLFDTAPGRRLSLPEYVPHLPPGTPMQAGFDELGTPLAEATFVVVDLETTGGSPTGDEITEIGAVKVRGGEVLGEFATLVNPGVPIPPQITVLTGITTAMVLDAPRLEEVFPTFLEFIRGCVLVAHNARFDVGFLRAAARSLGAAWGVTDVVDTLALARRVVSKDEAPNHKLASLAHLFRSPTAPDHRALSDAKATVDVLHGLFERLGSLGVTHVEDLRTAADPVPPARRRKVHLAERLPTGPGVYLFKGPGGEVLYVGTAKNLRRRVRSYFTSAPDRRRIGEMVDLAARVEVIECPTVLEAQVRELRLIAHHEPPYNRRSKRPTRLPWLRLTDEPLPRASIVRAVPREAAGIGPFSSRAQADHAAAALQELGLRACTRRLPAQVSPSARGCFLGEVGRCSAPCVDQGAADAYRALVARAQEMMTRNPRPAFDHHLRRMRELAAEERYEEAARMRDQVRALLQGVYRWQRLSPWWDSTQTVAARWSTDAYPSGAWEVVVARYGRLAASGVCPPTRDPLPFAADLAAGAAHVERPTHYAGAASSEETDLLATWMETPGVRLISHDGPALAWPVSGAKRLLEHLEDPTTPLSAGAGQ